MSKKILNTVDAKGVTENVFEQLENSILTGEITVGQKLPSEQELAEQAKVGRRAIREALKGLELKGLIEVRKGAGAFVIRNDFDSYIESLMRNVQSYLHSDRAKLTDLVRFRELLSGSIILFLSSERNAEIIDNIESILIKQEKAYKKKSTALYHKAHLEFHLAIVNSIQNPVVTMIYSQVIQVLEPSMKQSAKDFNIMRKAINEHKQILKGIKNGDVVSAQKAFHDHLRLSIEHLRSLYDNKKILNS